MRAITVQPRVAQSARIERVISRRVPLERWQEALDKRPDDIKVNIEFS
jgi:hypothetical protein